MKRLLLLPLCLLPLLSLAAPAPGSPAAAVRRFALLVGVNDGGPGRAKLRYAATDAESFGAVLEELGGVQRKDRMVLLEGNRAALEKALERFEAMIAAAKPSGGRTEAIVYYSGHSDEEGLLLGTDRFGYRELRQALDALSADVRIAILDSCASGTMARSKGGVRRPAFLVDASSAVRGRAILTSSSEDEVSQESDRVGGSFFTHNLVSGLRGAADSTGDGRVTLHEAYQFAFHETLARTEKTRGGAQHPAYDIELAGTGDLVMTDLRSTAATLVFGDDVEGRLFVRDEPGRLVVELNKLAGRATELGLQPGRYTVLRESRGASSQTELTLGEGARSELAGIAFRPVAGELTAMRGGGPLPVSGLGDMGTAQEVPSRQHRFLNLGIVPTIQTNDMIGGDVDNNFSMSFGVSRLARLEGLALALGGNWATDSTRGAQMAVGINVSQGTVGGTQLAVGGNWAAGRLEGIQGAAGFNFARQGGSGGQLAVGANLSDQPLTGLQLTAGLNLVRGRMDGFQGAAGMNWAAELHGAQLAVINVGGEVRGAQIGIVNVADKVKGLQFGVLNLANEVDGAPLGLLSLARNGQLHAEVFSTDVNPEGNVALKLGGEYAYTLFTAGTGGTGDGRHWTLGLGLGAHVPVRERFFVDLDLVTSSVHRSGDGFDAALLLHQLRAVVGWQVVSWVAIIAGPSFNVAHSVDGKPLGALSRFGRDSNEQKEAAVWPGALLGVRL